jgi:DNA helicase-2/ATP-dependent DNA helicase PcrA
MSPAMPSTTTSPLLDGLNPEQREAVTTPASPLRILAGAGSGKTRVLTRRIAYRCATDDADPRFVLALTFTRKAAGELQHRLRALGLRDRLQAGTFHAVAYAQLQARWAERNVPPPAVLDRKFRVLRGVVPRRPGLDAALADYATEIEWAKARLVRPSEYTAAAGAAHRRAPVSYGEMAGIYEQYERAKHRAGLVDFDDLLWRCIREMEDDANFGAAQRWRFRHLFVDEFQDVNPLQLRLLDLWRGDRDDLCVVGDPNQAIYAWNGADPTILTDFERRHPDAATVVLDENYRSSPQVLAVANAVLAGGDAKELRRLRATRPDGPVPEVRSYPTDEAEARAIARAARDLHGPNRRWAHQAVLTRTNAQSVLLERAFAAANVPCRVRGRGAFLELPEIKDTLRELSRARGGFVEALAALEARIQPEDLNDLEPPEPDEDGGGGEDRAELSDSELARRHNLDELFRLAGDYVASERTPAAAGFEAWLRATLRNEDAEAGGDAVEITTFHAAKGLEWPIVHLAGLESGLVPIGLARTLDAQAEERRLFYVAVTRAEQVLRLTWSETRKFGEKMARRSPSPYLDDVEHVLAALRAGTAPDDWRPHVAAQRARLSRRNAAPKTLDEPATELLRDLKQWRSGAAKAASVPAYVIFHDATLEAVARARPATRSALLACPGVGPVKVSRFGDDVLAVVARHGSG